MFNAANKTAKARARRSSPSCQQPRPRASARRRDAGDRIDAAASPTLAPDRPSTATGARAGPAAGEGRWALLFLAPTLIGLAFLSAGPILATFGISLTQWDLLTAPEFVGLDNYTRLLGDTAVPRWRSGTRRSTRSCRSRSGWLLSLGLAIALNQALRGIAWIRTAYFLPLVTSATAVGLVWAWIYSPTTASSTSSSACSASRPRSGSATRSGDAVDHRDERSGRACRPT